MNLSPHHVRYTAYDLTRRAPNDIGLLSMARFDAAVEAVLIHWLVFETEGV